MKCRSPKIENQAKLSQNKNQMDTSMVITYARHNQTRSPMVFMVIFCTLFLFTSFAFDFSFDFEFSLVFALFFLCFSLIFSSRFFFFMTTVFFYSLYFTSNGNNAAHIIHKLVEKNLAQLHPKLKKKKMDLDPKFALEKHVIKQQYEFHKITHQST